MMDFSSGCATSTSAGREGLGWGTSWWGGMGLRRGTPQFPPARTFGVQQPRHPQIPLGHGEGLVQVLQVALAVHPAHVDQHRPAGGGQQGSVGLWGPQNPEEGRSPLPCLYSCQAVPQRGHRWQGGPHSHHRGRTGWGHTRSPVGTPTQSEPRVL